MIPLLIVIVVVVGVVCCIGVVKYAEYKAMELEFKKEQSKHVSELTADETKLEIEREKTKQLQIKADYRDKYNSSLY